MGSVPLKRVGGIGKVAMALVGAVAVASVLGFVVSIGTVNDAKDFVDGRISEDEFTRAFLVYGLVGMLQSAAMIGSAVVVIIWMNRIATNHRTLHRVGTWGPGWAIGGWFLPPLLYVIPFLMFRELWKASDPDVPLGGDWRSTPVSPLVIAWFVVYGPVSLAVTIVSGLGSFSLSQNTEDLAQQMIDGQGTAALSLVVTAVAAGLFIAMAKQLTARHMRLTGEV